MTASTLSAAVFALVAQRVRRRVWLRRWLGWLGRTLWLVSALLGLLIFIHIFKGGVEVAVWGGFGLAVWLFGSAALAAWRLPGAYGALAFWDSQTGRREAFASAWWFEQQPARTSSEEAHLFRQRELLPQAEKCLVVDLPLPVRQPWLLLPLGLFIVLQSLPLIHREAGNVPLDAAMQAAAKTEADKLAKTDWEKKNLAGLTDPEKQELEQLKDNLKATAEALEQGEGKDARQVMADLERRAREAEKLARKLGLENEAWASESLVQALRTHADTADLGDAVAAKNATQAASHAEALAGKLQTPALPETALKRLQDTFAEIRSSAETADQERVAGQHVVGAAEHLKSGLPEPAGAEFQKLAEKLRELALREKSRQELEKLARQLRDAGSHIAGQNEAGGMQQMNAAAGESPQNSSSGQGQSGQTPQVGQSQAPASGQQPLQPPGLGQMNQGQMVQPNAGQPQQQPGNGQTMQVGQAGQPGQGQPGDGQPMLMAPVPGQKPGDKPPEMVVMAPPGTFPPDANAATMALSMPGGREPGVGKAELKADATSAQDVQQGRVVNAQPGSDGASSVRAVEGGVRQESANRSAVQTTVEFIDAQEEALDEAALPPNRRDQVRRYFTELRRRFESGSQD